MSDYWPGWLEYSDHIQLELVSAEWRRMQRTQDEADALYRRCARFRVRFILNRLARRWRTEP